LHLLIACKYWFLINHRIFLKKSLLIGVEQSFKNENTCDILLNDIKMEDEPLQKQIEGSRNLKTNG
jgi:hypothetical protein